MTLDTTGLNVKLWLDATVGTFQDAARTTAASADTDPVGGWADQSGNGNHVAQATAGKRPTLSIVSTVKGVKFVGASSQTISHLAIGVGSSYTKYVVVNFGSTTGNQVFLGNSSQAWYLAASNKPRLFQGGGNIAVPDTLMIATGTDYALMGLYDAADGWAWTGQNGQHAGGSSAPTISDDPVWLGSYTDAGNYFDGTIRELLVCSGAHTLAQRKLVTDYLNVKWGTRATPTINRQLLFQGDSRTYGTGATSGQGTVTGPVYPSRCVAGLTGISAWDKTNGGTAGITLTDGATGENVLSSSRTDVHLDDYTPLGVEVIWIGTNDMGGSGVTGANLEIALAAYCKRRRVLGWKVVVCTEITRADISGAALTTFESNRTTFNTNLKANWTGYADALVDLAADSRLQDANNVTYFSDHLHLTDTGYQAVADLVVAQTQPLIPAVVVASTGAALRRVAAVLYSAGTTMPANRPTWASYGAGVVPAGAVSLGVDVVTEAQAALVAGKPVVNLVRFSPGAAVPGNFRLVGEA